MQTLVLHFNTDVAPIIKADEQIVMLRGATVPADGTAGYSPGCIFMKTSGNGIGSTMYVNEGSAASCDFNAK